MIVKGETANVAYGLLLVLVNVAVCEGLLLPTTVDANVRVPGKKVTVAVGWLPVPVKLIVCEPAATLSVMVMVAGCETAALGVKVMVKVQLLLIASTAGQLLV